MKDFSKKLDKKFKFDFDVPYDSEIDVKKLKSFVNKKPAVAEIVPTAGFFSVVKCYSATVIWCEMVLLPIFRFMKYIPDERLSALMWKLC